MFNTYIRPYLPRSLFGRAVLILVLPIVLIQVVVGVVLIERLFQDVTRQMTTAVALDVNYLVANFLRDPARNFDDPELQRSASRLGMTFGPPRADGAAVDRRNFLDISGITVVDDLYRRVSGTQAVDLVRDEDRVFMTVERGGHVYEISFDRRRVSAKNPHQLLVAMVLAAILLTALSLLFLRNQIQPIRRLAHAAEAFGKGDVIALKPRGATEVRAAASAFLSMRTRIERQIEQRTMMLSGVSHDLRTPLTRMKLEASMIEGEDADALERDISEMEGILDEFLAFARGDSGEDAEDVQPKVLLKHLARKYRRMGHGITLNYTGDTSSDTPVRMRQMAISRALENLIGNALKHGDQLRLTLHRGADAISFSVEDDGPGIRKDLREEALKPFARLDSARNQDRGSGVGLGLAIAADIARSHGGALELGSSPDLGGLLARLTVPR